MTRTQPACSLAPPPATVLSGCLIQSLLLETVARSELGHADAVGRALERTLLAEVFHLLAGHAAVPLRSAPEPLDEPLTETEARVLRYLPTNLSKREIADELYVSVHTVRTHIKHLYAKLDVHSRGEAVEQARDFGLIPRGSRLVGRITPRAPAIGGESF